MGLFGKSKSSNSYLGVDIGASGIKLVELSSQKGRPKLMTYGYSERKAGDPMVSPLDDPKKTGALLAKLLNGADVKTKKAMAALPSSGVFSTIISVPRGKNEKEMKPIIDAEVGKLTPLPINEMITYSTFIDGVDKKKVESRKKKESGGKKEKEKKDESKFVRVLVTGAAKTLVQKYIEIFRVAGLELEAIDTEAFSLIRSLVGKDRSSIMLLDIGGTRTNITVVEKGVPMLTRSINIGGDAVTKRLAEQMQVGANEAEQTKRDLSGAGGALPPFLESVMQPILHEIRYSFQLYGAIELAEKDQVEKIILTGGSSNLPGVDEYLANALNLNVYIGDPWARVSYPEPIRSALDEIGPKMAVSVGLAMRELE